jgi:Leucine-rich repeat (LRR) protein
MKSIALVCAMLSLNNLCAAARDEVSVFDLVNLGRISISSAISRDRQDRPCLNLSYMGLTNLDGLGLPGAATVERLYLINNRLTALKRSDFACVPALRFLHLEQNDLSALDFDTFADLPHLEGIYVSHNKLTNVTAVLNVFDRLRYINVAGNYISSFTPTQPNLMLMSLILCDNPLLVLDTYNIAQCCPQLREIAPDVYGYVSEHQQDATDVITEWSVAAAPFYRGIDAR